MGFNSGFKGLSALFMIGPVLSLVTFYEAGNTVLPAF